MSNLQPVEYQKHMTEIACYLYYHLVHWKTILSIFPAYFAPILSLSNRVHTKEIIIISLDGCALTLLHWSCRILSRLYDSFLFSPYSTGKCPPIDGLKGVAAVSSRNRALWQSHTGAQGHMRTFSTSTSVCSPQYSVNHLWTDSAHVHVACSCEHDAPTGKWQRWIRRAFLLLRAFITRPVSYSCFNWWRSIVPTPS